MNRWELEGIGRSDPANIMRVHTPRWVVDLPLGWIDQRRRASIDR